MGVSYTIFIDDEGAKDIDLGEGFSLLDAVDAAVALSQSYAGKVPVRVGAYFGGDDDEGEAKLIWFNEAAEGKTYPDSIEDPIVISKFRIPGDLAAVINRRAEADHVSVTRACQRLIRDGSKLAPMSHMVAINLRSALRSMENGVPNAAIASLRLALEAVTIDRSPSQGANNGSTVHRDRSASPGPCEFKKA